MFREQTAVAILVANVLGWHGLSLVCCESTPNCIANDRRNAARIDLFPIHSVQLREPQAAPVQKLQDHQGPRAVQSVEPRALLRQLEDPVDAATTEVAG